jgi:hypothetical protein
MIELAKVCFGRVLLSPALRCITFGFAVVLLTASGAGIATAVDDAYHPPSDAMSGEEGVDTYRNGAPPDDSYRPPATGSPAPPSRSYDAPPSDSYAPYRGAGSGRGSSNPGGYGEPYHEPPGDSASREEHYEQGPPNGEYVPDGGPPPANSYSQDEIVRAGHSFFGKVTGGLAEAVEWAFHKVGRPNGYILGQDAGGAIVAGLRYGEGMLYTKDAGNHKVYWQGPSVGYDFGGEGSKVMTLVYNLHDPAEIFDRFGGVQGAAYLVGGVSVQFEKAGHVTLAPIRAGVGVRLGANVGYLKYTRYPTWNPF